MKILFIYSSPTINSAKGSISNKMSDIFEKEYKRKNPAHNILRLNLNSASVGLETLTSENFAEFFKDTNVDGWINQLKEVDKIVISASMTNFNVPAVLKNYIDHICVAKKTFIYKYDRNGESEGLLKHLKVQILTTQGADYGWYMWGNHTEYVKGTFEFLGAKVLKPISIYGTKTPSKINLSIEDVVKEKEDEIKEAARKF